MDSDEEREFNTKLDQIKEKLINEEELDEDEANFCHCDVCISVLLEQSDIHFSDDDEEQANILMKCFLYRVANRSGIIFFKADDWVRSAMSRLEAIEIDQVSKVLEDPSTINSRIKAANQSPFHRNVIKSMVVEASKMMHIDFAG